MPTIPALLERITAAASVLDDTAAQDLIDALTTHSGASKLQLLVAGSTGSGRASLANIMLDRPGLLPQSPIPKAPISITVRHGPSDSVEAVSVEGVRSAIAPERLRSFLTSPATAGRYTSVEVHTPSEILTACDLRLEPIEADRPDGRWKALLAGIDYVILVLNANALLSELERRFVREHLSTGFGLHRVAIVVNGMDLIPEEERESIVDLVRVFLGPFESQPAQIAMSALDAASDTAEGGYDDLMTLMDDLLERQAPLRAATARRTLDDVLIALEETARRRQALLAIDEEDAVRLRERIASRRDWLQRRVERAQHRADAFLNTILKERLLREIESFADAIRHRLPDEVRSVQDIATVKKYLPGYMETVWKEFLHSQMIAVRAGLLDETRRIEDLVAGDLEELTRPHPGGTRHPVPGDAAPNLWGNIGSFDAGAHAMHIFVMPKRGKHQASGIAKSLSYFGLGTFIMSPPLAVFSLGASVLIRRVFKGSMDDADRDAIATAALAASRDLERELKGRIEKQFDALIGDVNVRIAGLYRQGVEGIETVLDESAVARQNIEFHRERLDELVQTTLPELRALIAQSAAADLSSIREPAPA